MSVNYYDLLDVDPSASREEIRTAWKAAVADLDPSDRRFKVYNGAAEVLLDDTRRRAYDASLAPAEEPTPAQEPERVVPASGTAAEPSRGPVEGESGVRRLASVLVPAWLLVGLLVLTVAVAGFDAWQWQKPSDDQINTDTRDAQATAERAIVPILSYDYRNLDASKAAASAYFSSNYGACYAKLFALIKQNAPTTQTVITTQVVASAITRAESSNSDRVQVLVFVNRPTTNKVNPTPVVYHDEVTVTMVKQGSDWLVDNLQTEAGSGSSC